MSTASDSVLLVLENTVYWNGTYVLPKTPGLWDYQCDFCFYVRALTGNQFLVELHDCTTVVARFYLSPCQCDVSLALEVDDDYRLDLENATARLELYE